MKSRTDNISSEAKTSKGIAYDSRWMIISVIALTLFLFCLEGRAQLVSSNPMEYVALAEGNELINGQIKNQIEDPQKRASILSSAIRHMVLNTITKQRGIIRIRM